MTIVVRPLENPRTWNSFVYQYSPFQLFQSWEWGELQKELGSTLWRVGLWENDTLIGVASVIKITARRGTYLHVRHGPIFVSQQKKYWDAFLQWIKDLGKKEHAWFIRISPLLVPTGEHTALLDTIGFVSSPLHDMDAERCWVLDLDIPENALLEGMDKTTRYEIRRAIKLGATVDISKDPQDVQKFLSLYTATSARHGFVPHHGLEEEFRLFLQKKEAILLIGSYEGVVVAGALVLFTPKQAIYHHGASIPVKASVSSLIQWEAIREAKKRGLGVYNFWGIAPHGKQNHPWSGLTAFKKGFGGRETVYLHTHDYPIESWYIIPKTIETIERITRGY